MPGNFALEVALWDANDDAGVFWADLCDDCVPLPVWALEGLDEALCEVALFPADRDTGPVDVLLARPTASALARGGLGLFVEDGVRGGEGVVLLLGKGEHLVCVVQEMAGLGRRVVHHLRRQKRADWCESAQRSSEGQKGDIQLLEQLMDVCYLSARSCLG